MTDFYELQEFQQKCSIGTSMTSRCFTPVLKYFYIHGHTVILTLHQVTVTSYDNLEHAA